MDELNFTFKMPDDETLAKYISIKGEKGEKGDPTKLSELENDTGFVTASTDALTNYYTKAQTDSAIETDVSALKTELGVPAGFFTDASEIVTGEGQTITLNNTANAAFKDVRLYGNTSQNGTPTPENPVAIQTATGAQTIIISDNDQQSQSYTISLGDIELCRIGDYKDYIYKGADGWYVHKAVGKVILEEGDIQARGSTRTSGYYRWYIKCGKNIVAATNDDIAVAYCTIAPAGTRNTTYARTESLAFTADNRFLMYLDVTSQMTVADANTWLGQNNPIVYYALDEPTDELVSDQALISQLDAIKNARSYDGTTIISISGSLASFLSVAAFTNNWSGTISGLNNDQQSFASKTTASIDEIENKIDNIDRELEEVEYIFPQNWGLTLSGDANLIKAYGKTILIDTHRAGNKAELEQMLTNHGASHIDYLIITHYHDDHMGNVANLITDGYVTPETAVFTPADCDMIDESEYLTDLKNRVINALEAAGIDYHTPEEYETIELDGKFVLTFYNTDTDAINQMTNYNNGSIICKIEHGSTKALYTGDALGSALNRALNNGFIDGHIDLYKVEHHGIQYDNTFPRVLETIQPEYAVQPSGQGDAQLNNYSVSTTLGYLQSRGCKVYSCHLNEEDIIFKSTVNGITVAQGMQSPSISNNNHTGGFLILYVDASTTNTVQNGTSNYPFKDLSQAIGACERMNSGLINIRLKDGEYCVTHPSNDKNDPRFNGLDIDIASATGNAANAIIRGKLSMRNSNVTISNIDFRPTGEYRETTIAASYTNLTLLNCSFDGTAAPADPTMIWSQHSRIVLDGCSVGNYNIALSAHYDELFSLNTEFENIALSSFYLRHSVLREHGTSYTNAAAKVTMSNGSYTLGTKRVPLWEGNSTSGNLALNEAATGFNKLLIISGTVAGGTLLGDAVYSYNQQNFVNGSNYNFRTLEDNSKISFSDSGMTATITRGASSPTLAIRGIYGMVEEFESTITTTS